MLKQEVRKSRDQKFTEFYESLQQEYVVAELRNLIYPEGQRKNKSLEIMEAKKKKILDISLRNRLGCIFEGTMLGVSDLYDSRLRKKIYDSIYPEFGTPCFVYRDDDQKSKLNSFDLKYYYKLESIFTTYNFKEGVLKKVDFMNKSCELYISGKNYSFDFQEVKRKL